MDNRHPHKTVRNEIYDHSATNDMTNSRLMNCDRIYSHGPHIAVPGPGQQISHNHRGTLFYRQDQPTDRRTDGRPTEKTRKQAELKENSGLFKRGVAVDDVIESEKNKPLFHLVHTLSCEVCEDTKTKKPNEGH